ncbi:GNAT family N-acetyltransferase [Blautia sp. 1033sp1_1033st1_G9_1033SCRN_220408]|uniref:GNAT family N-acetyltransferase n=1 Tax=Blautia sp. 1033sp1_1033st1_G9_1033SCRN_220408 TaxID=3144490 RepID=UPI0034A1D3C0
MRKETDMLCTRALTEEDADAVFMLDEKSGNCVSEWLDSTDFAWGFFKEDQLVGYCTTGYADDCPFSIENHPLHTDDSLLLSNVFILPEYRHQGYGKKMIKEAICHRWELDHVQNTVFLTIMYDDLVSFYQKIGFQVILPYEGDMVLQPGNILGGTYYAEK